MYSFELKFGRNWSVRFRKRFCWHTNYCSYCLVREDNAVFSGNEIDVGDYGRGINYSALIGNNVNITIKFSKMFSPLRDKNVGALSF